MTNKNFIKIKSTMKHHSFIYTFFFMQIGVCLLFFNYGFGSAVRSLGPVIRTSKTVDLSKIKKTNINDLNKYAKNEKKHVKRNVRSKKQAQVLETSKLDINNDINLFGVSEYTEITDISRENILSQYNNARAVILANAYNIVSKDILSQPGSTTDIDNKKQEDLFGTSQITEANINTYVAMPPVQLIKNGLHQKNLIANTLLSPENFNFLQRVRLQNFSEIETEQIKEIYTDIMPEEIKKMYIESIKQSFPDLTLEEQNTLADQIWFHDIVFETFTQIHNGVALKDIPEYVFIPKAGFDFAVFSIKEAQALIDKMPEYKAFFAPEVLTGEATLIAKDIHKDGETLVCIGAKIGDSIYLLYNKILKRDFTQEIQNKEKQISEILTQAAQETIEGPKTLEMYKAEFESSKNLVTTTIENYDETNIENIIFTYTTLSAELTKLEALQKEFKDIETTTAIQENIDNIKQKQGEIINAIESLSPETIAENLNQILEKITIVSPENITELFENMKNEIVHIASLEKISNITALEQFNLEKFIEEFFETEKKVEPKAELFTGTVEKIEPAKLEIAKTVLPEPKTQPLQQEIASIQEIKKPEYPEITIDSLTAIKTPISQEITPEKIIQKEPQPIKPPKFDLEKINSQMAIVKQSPIAQRFLSAQHTPESFKRGLKNLIRRGLDPDSQILTALPEGLRKFIQEYIRAIVQETQGEVTSFQTALERALIRQGFNQNVVDYFKTGMNAQERTILLSFIQQSMYQAQAQEKIDSFSIFIDQKIPTITPYQKKGILTLYKESAVANVFIISQKDWPSKTFEILLPEGARDNAFINQDETLAWLKKTEDGDVIIAINKQKENYFFNNITDALKAQGLSEKIINETFDMLMSKAKKFDVTLININEVKALGFVKPLLAMAPAKIEPKISKQFSFFNAENNIYIASGIDIIPEKIIPELQSLFSNKMTRDLFSTSLGSNQIIKLPQQDLVSILQTQKAQSDAQIMLGSSILSAINNAKPLGEAKLETIQPFLDNIDAGQIVVSAFFSHKKIKDISPNIRQMIFTDDNRLFDKNGNLILKASEFQDGFEIIFRPSITITETKFTGAKALISKDINQATNISLSSSLNNIAQSLDIPITTEQINIFTKGADAIALNIIFEKSTLPKLNIPKETLNKPINLEHPQTGFRFNLTPIDIRKNLTMISLTSAQQEELSKTQIQPEDAQEFVQEGIFEDIDPQIASANVVIEAMEENITDIKAEQTIIAEEIEAINDYRELLPPDSQEAANLSKTETVLEEQNSYLEEYFKDYAKNFLKDWEEHGKEENRLVEQLETENQVLDNYNDQLKKQIETISEKAEQLDIAVQARDNLMQTNERAKELLEENANLQNKKDVILEAQKEGKVDTQRAANAIEQIDLKIKENNIFIYSLFDEAQRISFKENLEQLTKNYVTAQAIINSELMTVAKTSVIIQALLTSPLEKTIDITDIETISEATNKIVDNINELKELDELLPPEKPEEEISEFDPNKDKKIKKEDARKKLVDVRKKRLVVENKITGSNPLIIKNRIEEFKKEVPRPSKETDYKPYEVEKESGPPEEHEQLSPEKPTLPKTTQKPSGTGKKKDDGEIFAPPIGFLPPENIEDENFFDDIFNDSDFDIDDIFGPDDTIFPENLWSDVHEDLSDDENVIPDILKPLIAPGVKPPVVSVIPNDANKYLPPLGQKIPISNLPSIHDLKEAGPEFAQLPGKNGAGKQMELEKEKPSGSGTGGALGSGIGEFIKAHGKKIGIGLIFFVIMNVLRILRNQF